MSYNNQYSSFYHQYQVPTENRVPSKAKRSNLPRLSTKIPTQSPPTGYLPIRSPLLKFQSTTKRPFSQKDKSPEPSIDYEKYIEKPWSFRSDTEESDQQNSNWTATDATSPFSRQLANFTRGSNEDLWAACRPMLPVPRPAWPADGSHTNRSADLRCISKESVGKKVLVGGKELGTLRYYGRTAFASGTWCGIELDNPVGKNDGSVDGVIYFTCPVQYGIFAPESKITLLPLSPEMPAKRLKYESQRDPTFRLSTASTSSNNSSGSALSIDSQKRLSSGSSAATYTIRSRSDESFPGTPEDLKPVICLKRIHSSQEEGSSDAASQSGAYDDSSLGILSPEQMVDQMTGSLRRSPSDEHIDGFNDEIFEEGAVGGVALAKWNSEESMPALNEELLQNDIFAILKELQRTDSSSSPSVKSPIDSHNDDEVSQVVPESVVNTTSHKKLSFNLKSHKDNNSREFPNATKSRNIENTGEWGQESVENMTTSAASLDQGYQGDGEFDAPSEAGSMTTSSPTETDRNFKDIMHGLHFPVYPTSCSLTSNPDISLADEETECDVNFISGDRRARIIDGKLYHNHKELIGIKHFDGKIESHYSEMDSSGFYSDLDPRDEDSKIEFNLLRPLEEGRTEMDFSDSVIDDITRCDDVSNELDSDVSKSEMLSQEKVSKSSNGTNSPSSQAASIIEEVASRKTKSTEDTSVNLDSKEMSKTPSLENDDNLLDQPQRAESSNLIEPEKTRKNITVEDLNGNEPCTETQPSVTPKHRTYEKPWKSKPPPLKRTEKPKNVLPPPPPMPKKNVQSKLKIMLESSDNCQEERKQRQQKKGRWDDVMNRIEEGKKEDSLRPKVKEVKSRLLESLKAPQPPSPQVEKIRQERRERRERRERQTAISRRASDRKRSITSNRNSRAPSIESLVGVPSSTNVNSESSTPDISQRSGSSGVSPEREPF